MGVAAPDGAAKRGSFHRRLLGGGLSGSKVLGGATRDEDSAGNRTDADVTGDGTVAMRTIVRPKWAERSPREVRESTALSVHDG